MNMLEIIETNRNIRKKLKEAKDDYNKKIYSINHTEGINYFKKNNLRAEETLKYGGIIDEIKSSEKYGNIVVIYNNKIPYDLATMKIRDSRRIFNSDGSLKDGFYLIYQEVTESDLDTFSNMVATNLFYLRELAYIYFKNYRNANSQEFCELVNRVTNEYEVKDISTKVIEAMYSCLSEKDYMSEDIAEASIKKVEKATNVYIKRKQK